MNVELSPKPRYPIGFVSSDFEVVQQCAFHLDIIREPVQILVEGWMAGAVSAFGVKQDRSTGFQSAAGIFQAFVRLAQIDIEWVPTRGCD